MRGYFQLGQLLRRLADRLCGGRMIVMQARTISHRARAQAPDTNKLDRRVCTLLASASHAPEGTVSVLICLVPGLTCCLGARPQEGGYALSYAAFCVNAVMEARPVISLSWRPCPNLFSCHREGALFSVSLVTCQLDHTEPAWFCAFQNQ